VSGVFWRPHCLTVYDATLLITVSRRHIVIASARDMASAADEAVNNIYATLIYERAMMSGLIR